MRGTSRSRSGPNTPETYLAVQPGSKLSANASQRSPPERSQPKQSALRRFSSTIRSSHGRKREKSLALRASAHSCCAMLATEASSSTRSAGSFVALS